MQHIPPTVRLGTPEDEEGILALCWRAHEERQENMRRSLSRPKVIARVRGCLEGAGPIGVIDVDGDIRAICALAIASPYYSDDLELVDWLVYVRPDCRHLRYLSPLLRFARKQAIAHNMPVCMGWIGDERSEAKSKAYQRHFAKFGECYIFDPTGRTSMMTRA